MQLYTKILIGLVAGGVFGGVANYFQIEMLISVFSQLEVLGTAFINLITMIVIPLVVASLLVGTASLGDLRKLGRIGGKTLAYYMTTTAIAVTIGLGLANLIKPGAGIAALERMDLADQAPGWVETLLSIIPRNPVQAAAEMDLLSLIFFTICFGAALTVIQDDRRDAVLKFFHGINDASMTLINWIMELAPYAVFVLIAAVVSNFGLDLLQSLLMYTGVVVLGLAMALLQTNCGGSFARILDVVVQRDLAADDRDF